MDAGAVGAVALGYFLGSVDFGVIIPRLRNIDIYSRGSGNPGATNVLRAMGRGAAAAVLVGDLAKGFAAAVIGDAIGGDTLAIASGFGAVVGHCFPVWHRFRGGKGVAAAGGMTLWVEPILGLGLLVIWAVLFAIWRRASVASITVAAALVPGLFLLDHREWDLVWSGAVAVLVVFRHQANLRRLIGGSGGAVEAAR